jgi:hypothetical protein
MINVKTIKFGIFSINVLFTFFFFGISIKSINTNKSFKFGFIKNVFQELFIILLNIKLIILYIFILWSVKLYQKII